MEFGEVIPLQDTWRAMEEAVELGLVKHIGLSNFNSLQIQQILEAAKIRPAVLQCECHPYLNQEKLISFCRENGVVFTGYSPLGSPGRPSNWDFTLPVLMENETVTSMASKYGQSVAQILIRWQIQKGIVVVPKSVTPQRIRSNLEVWNFEIAREDMETLNSLHQNVRYCVEEEAKPHPHYPFHEEF